MIDRSANAPFVNRPGISTVIYRFARALSFSRKKSIIIRSYKVQEAANMSKLRIILLFLNFLHLHLLLQSVHSLVPSSIYFLLPSNT
jgi:hypothetical protein